MQSQNRAGRKKKRKRRSFIRSVLMFLLIIFIAVIVTGGYVLFQAYTAANGTFVEMERGEKSDKREKPVQISTDPVSILLLGIENYGDEYDVGRTDTLIVATFNPKDQSMKMLSIPRDTRVEIPGREREDKINHAYSYGGKETTIETIEEFLDIPIDYFVTVNFDGFINIIDEVGGVKVDVPFDFNEINSKYERFYFEEGPMELDGEAALVYARMRKKDPRGDFGRNERQQQIVKGVIDKLSNPAVLFKINNIAQEIGKSVETNIRINEALAFRQKYSSFNSSNIESLTIKGEDLYDRNVYYYVPLEDSIEELRGTLRTHLELENDENTLQE